MKAPLADTSSTFQVHSAHASAPANDHTDSANSPARLSASHHPSHSSPVFRSPTHPHPSLPYLYQPDQHYMKKPAASIGYSRHAQLSHNMHLSLGWDTQGALKRWEKEKPFAVRDEREREERRRRGEAEEPRRTFDLWSAFPPVIRSVPAGPADYSIHHNNPIAPTPPAALQTATSLPASSSSSIRKQAAALLAAGNAYDPYAAISNPFFTSAPSNYTAIYANPPPHTSPLPATTHKPNLTSYPSTSYSLPFSAGQPSKRRNNRWTEERLFFRGYSASGSDEASGAMAVRPQQGRDLLFEQPMYSSFTLDGVYREPQRRRGAKKQRWVKVETPRMRVRQPDGAQMHQADEADRMGGMEDGSDGVEWGDEDGGGGRSVEKVEVRLSGVFVPRVSSRFIPSTSLPLCKPRWD